MQVAISPFDTSTHLEGHAISHRLGLDTPLGTRNLKKEKRWGFVQKEVRDPLRNDLCLCVRVSVCARDWGVVGQSRVVGSLTGPRHLPSIVFPPCLPS